jgi:O-antigen biosynthesis protein WbqP
MKRILDIALTVIILAIFSPIIVFATIIIFAFDGAPVFFLQERVGIHAESFVLYKFRTMKRDAPGNIPTGELLNSSCYITKLGKFLRKTSIDELPQLLNVIKGDMSLVGPRPVVSAERDLVSKRKQNGTYLVRPGITGWAQVNGRDNVTVDQKVAYDRYYVENQSLAFDMHILFKTAWQVLHRSDVWEGGEAAASMEKLSAPPAQKPLGLALAGDVYATKPYSEEGQQ